MNQFGKPVSVGDVLEVTVRNRGDEGDGIAFLDGFVIFVSGADVGDEVTVRVEKVTANCAFAEVWSDDV